MKGVQQSKRYLIWQSNFLATAALLTFSAFIGVVSLQSSVNIAKELGTTSLAVTYGTSMICNLTLTTFIVKRLGAKLSLIAADVLYILYTLANLYPAYGMLLSAAFLLGIAQAITWCVLPLFNTFFGEEYSKLVAIEAAETKKMAKAFGAYVRRFVGRFFSIFSAYLIIGNLSSFIILHFDESQNIKLSQFDNESIAFNVTSIANYTNIEDNYSLCGANQCSASRTLSTEESGTKNQKYLIQSWTLKLILFIFFAALQLAALLIHVFLLKETKSDQLPKADSLLSVNILNDSNDLSEKPDNNSNKPKVKWFKEIAQNTIRLLQHLVNLQQLLIIPLNIHYGFTNAFIFGDLTRSFVSCISGVQQLPIGDRQTLLGSCWFRPSGGYRSPIESSDVNIVTNHYGSSCCQFFCSGSWKNQLNTLALHLKVGLVMVVFGVCEIVSGLAIERLSVTLGRKLFLTISYVFELANFLFCLLWSPSAASWVPYYLAVFFGLSDGLRQPLLTATVMEYFNHKREIAFSTMALLTGLGSSLAYFSSRYLCVNEKLCVLIATSIFSAICLAFAERRFHKSEIR